LGKGSREGRTGVFEEGYYRRGGSGGGGGVGGDVHGCNSVLYGFVICILNEVEYKHFCFTTRLSVMVKEGC